MPFAMNIVFLGVTGLVGLWLGVLAIVERVVYKPDYCNKKLIEDLFYGGSYEECLHWKATYAPLVFTWLAILCVYRYAFDIVSDQENKTDFDDSLVQIVLFIHTGVDYYRTRSREGGLTLEEH